MYIYIYKDIYIYIYICIYRYRYILSFQCECQILSHCTSDKVKEIEFISFPFNFIQIKSPI